MGATLELNRSIAPEFGTCFFFRPYKGTHLYELCRQNGLLKEQEEVNNITSNRIRPFIKLTNVSERECIRWNRKIRLYLITQTFKYQCALFWRTERGARKLLLPFLVIHIVLVSAKVYCEERIKKY